jgi:hypothetical protein
MHLLLQQPTPNTVAYMIAGYAVIGSVGLIYIISLVVRQRNLKRDIETLEMLTREDDA